MAKVLDRRVELQILKEEAAQCRQCPALVANRTQVVFGEGNPHAEIMLVGEAPGRTEDRDGHPFIGQAGRLLNNMLSACKWDRDNVYIANSACCRPPNNRIPTAEEMHNCRRFLDAQISVIKPKYLILLGSTASINLLGMSIGVARGRLHTYNGIKTLCTYHPAYLLRNLAKKKDAWEDLQIVLKDKSHENQ